MRKGDPAGGTGALGLGRPLHGDPLLEEGEEQEDRHHPGLHWGSKHGPTYADKLNNQQISIYLEAMWVLHIVR